MHIAAIIVNYRTPHLSLRSLAALNRERELIPNLKAVVVDNGSDDESASILGSTLSHRQYADWAKFLPLGLNGGFGWGNNQAMLLLLKDHPPPDAIFLLNPDAVIEHGALFALVEDLQKCSDAGAVGSQLMNEDGTFSGSAFRFPTVAREFMRGLGIGAIGRLLRIAPVLMPYGFRGPVDWATGASVLLRTQALRDAGMFDTGFFLYFEEVELMHRFARHGWKTYHCPESRVTHIAGASTGVVNGRTKNGVTTPDYVFRSRSRYFALTGGRGIALAADLAWLVGAGMSCFIKFATKRHEAPAAWADFRVLRRLGLGAKLPDKIPAVTRTNDTMGQSPAWMKS
jgi:N-acetylglucosaminyl-diphospho-decaprenol L-rhamnosyltransferase